MLTKVFLFLILAISPGMAAENALMLGRVDGLEGSAQEVRVFLRTNAVPGEVKFTLLQPGHEDFVEAGYDYRGAMDSVDASIGKGFDICFKVLLGMAIPTTLFILCSSVFIFGMIF